MTGSDSAGIPWEGRRFEPNAAAGDDGSVDPRLADAVRRLRTGEAGPATVVDALRDTRLLVPLVAEAGDEGVGPHGRRVDKTQELSLVTVAAPDGRRALPAFSSAAAMAAWNPRARPIPVDARRVALSAAAEGTELVVLDPGSDAAFVLRRPALAALATGRPWSPPFEDERVVDAILRAVELDPDVMAGRALNGDPGATLDGPELVVAVVLREGIADDERRAALERLSAAWSADPILRESVDSLAVSVVS